MLTQVIHRSLVAALSIATLCSFAAAQKATDVVLKKDGARLRGLQITEFSLSGIKATRGDTPVEVPAHQILDVAWGDLPDAFVAARAALERGDALNAVQLFGEAANAAKRDLVKHDAEFFQLKAAVASIGTDQNAARNAADRAKSWVSSNSTHWRIPEALLLAGRAQRLAGATDEAATTLKDLDDRASREGFGAVWSARAKFELAQALLDGGKSSDARSAFQAASLAADTALGQPSGDDAELRTIKLLAKVGEGETYIGDKDYSKAESFFGSLKRSDSHELAAAGHAGEGEAILLNAMANGRADELRRAQIALATAAVLDAGTGQVAAKANYYLGLCLLALGQEREGDTFKDRAKAYFQLVTNNYPTTRWAGLARAELAK
ncbi:MAG: hypothetical protein KDC48_17490 [Planctomycetes bacterium]|nr:hypothetical protein [Planctomycetota bacterium]